MTTVVLLAAGRSRRFGAACKLQAVYRNKPLVRHAADAILQTGLPAVAVVSDPAVARLLPEFKIVYSSGLQSDSLRVGLHQVAEGPALVVLADMPHVDAGLLHQIAASPAPAATTDRTRICPPALIPHAIFPDLEKLTGDRGAGNLLRSLPGLHRVVVSEDMVKDVDVPQDILEYQEDRLNQDLPTPPRT
ncbi:nucleotidyltransferase family protein [Paracoccus benzoatiresistens]|uniref:NTP transferase domain-containing protein n=1 Tax=Paracoccus benzoatiresistens TaxID=2997341 RepID=A0ABT4J427_9RHOB|nr:NTP transferase domain-containing protein [Paracoccus sp. EF6]MCZ0961400.1 NTP transferase domain-containing protein [Paracoccus sp. EF6]